VTGRIGLAYGSICREAMVMDLAEKRREIEGVRLR